MAFIATRAMTIGGRQVKRGDVVSPRLLPAGKAEQLIGMRRLRDTTLARSYVALRRITLAGQDYVRGEVVDTTKLGMMKVAQLLEHRIIEPTVRAATA